MRLIHSTLLSGGTVCHQVVDHVVAHLGLTDFRQSVPAVMLARLLLWAAATRRSLSALCGCSDKTPSEETVRQALLYCLPGDQQELQRRLVQGLHALIPRATRRRQRPLAVDLHLRPYYGDATKANVLGGHRKAGTQYFWTYATLVVLVRGLRVTVGLTAVEPGQSLTAVVDVLLAQARQAGVRPAWLLLDRGFYAAEVVQYLQQQGLKFVMPLIRRGKKAPETGTWPFFRSSRSSGWDSYTWTTRLRRWDEATGKKRKTTSLTVTVDVCIRARPGQSPWVFIAQGIRWEPGLLAKRYRRRFGIETSYRQLHECLAATTSRDSRVRLLLVGLALIIRQWWVWMHATVLVEKRPRSRRLHLERLRLEDLKLWLHGALAKLLGWILVLETQQPLPLIT